AARATPPPAGLPARRRPRRPRRRAQPQCVRDSRARVFPMRYRRRGLARRKCGVLFPPPRARSLSFLHAYPQVGRLAVEMLKKEISANCGQVLVRPLDRVDPDVSVLLAPSTERK